MVPVLTADLLHVDFCNSIFATRQSSLFLSSANLPNLLTSCFRFCHLVLLHSSCFFPLISLVVLISLAVSFQISLPDQRTESPFSTASSSSYIYNMFSPRLNLDEEPQSNFPLTDLSLSTGIVVRTPQHCEILSNAEDKIQPKSISFTRKYQHPFESQGSLLQFKKQRSLQGAALTIGTGSSSDQFKISGLDQPEERLRSAASFSAGSGVYGGEYARNEPIQVTNRFGACNASELRGVDKARNVPYCQFVDGLMMRNENGNRMNGYGGSEVNVFNKGSPYQQSVWNGGLSTFENSKKMSAYSRGGASFVHTSASEKIRHRMIKNRESAARSRARKQASFSPLSNLTFLSFPFHKNHLSKTRDRLYQLFHQRFHVSFYTMIIYCNSNGFYQWMNLLLVTNRLPTEIRC